MKINGKKAGAMAIDDSSSSVFSPWPDRLRHSAIVLLAAGLALSVLVALGELALIRAVAVFLCIAAAALVPWRLHDAVASREDVRGVNPVEAAAVSAVVAGMPDPAVLLTVPVASFISTACAVGPALRARTNSRTRAALAGNHHRAARGHRDQRTAPRHLSRPRAGRPLDGTDDQPGAGAHFVRRYRQVDGMTFHDQTPLRRRSRKCAPTSSPMPVTNCARRWPRRLHRYAVGPPGRCQGARTLPFHHARAGDADGAADR